MAGRTLNFRLYIKNKSTGEVYACEDSEAQFNNLLPSAVVTGYAKSCRVLRDGRWVQRGRKNKLFTPIKFRKEFLEIERVIK